MKMMFISMKKSISSLLLIAILFLNFPFTAIAEEENSLENIVMPRWTYIVEAESDLTIRNEIATVDCRVKGSINSATKAKVIAELQVKSGTNNWIPVAIWTETMNGYESYVSESKNVTDGNTYRVKSTFIVWEGTQSETIYQFTDEVTA